jgi:hypothetical protein
MRLSRGNCHLEPVIELESPSHSFERIVMGNLFALFELARTLLKPLELPGCNNVGVGHVDLLYVRLIGAHCRFRKKRNLK